MAEKEDVSQTRIYSEYVTNAILKSVGKWTELGSSTEIDESQIVYSRPLLTYEVQGETLLSKKKKIKNATKKKFRTDYVEYQPPKVEIESLTTEGKFLENEEDEEEEAIYEKEEEEEYLNVYRKLVSNAVQAIPVTDGNETQTRFITFNDANTVYSYEFPYYDFKYQPADKILRLKNFVKENGKILCDEAVLNATWDIYENDFRKLTLDPKHAVPPIAISYTQQLSFYDGNLIGDQVISHLCWHPLMTGIAIVAYSRYSKSHVLSAPAVFSEVEDCINTNHKVVIWSFTDSLTPKLILESPREVTAVAVCPLYGNTVIGGCSNGQIVIWDITGKIEEVEMPCTRTVVQNKYRMKMQHLMNWMKEIDGISIVRHTAMSALKFSQKDAITAIEWLPSHNKVNKNGRIETLPKHAKITDLHRQFVTSSKDGTIAFWDLNWRPPEKKPVRYQKHEHKRRRPSDLVKSISELKILDNVFKPDYVVTVFHPVTGQQLPVTFLNIYRPMFQKQQVPPIPSISSGIHVRKYYQLIIKKPKYKMEPKILVGTMTGDFGCLTWEGFEFSTGAILNREQGKWQWIRGLHDGPVTKIVRSKFYNDVVATIGGTIFAIWREDYNQPVIFKKLNIRCTSCTWGSFRPTILIVGLINGTIEIWDFIVKSHVPSFTQSISGRIITGISTHELPLEPQCIGICDASGTLRMYTAPQVFRFFADTDILWMRKFIDDQVARLKLNRKNTK